MGATKIFCSLREQPKCHRQLPVCLRLRNSSLVLSALQSYIFITMEFYMYPLEGKDSVTKYGWVLQIRDSNNLMHHFFLLWNFLGTTSYLGNQILVLFPSCIFTYFHRKQTVLLATLISGVLCQIIFFFFLGLMELASSLHVRIDIVASCFTLSVYFPYYSIVYISVHVVFLCQQASHLYLD